MRKINASAFGPAGMGMREILGYAPIQPDGSVQIQVPANVPFTIDMLDANARRITAQHTSWLQLMPGETKSCNGCHTVNPTDPTSHGRSGLTLPVNQGAPDDGRAVPEHQFRAVRECRGNHGADPGANQLRARERAELAVLADLGHGRALCNRLDHRRNDAAGT